MTGGENVFEGARDAKDRSWRLLAIVALNGAALAQNYPSRPITIIVPFSAGGPSERDVSRILAERMKATLGETVLVENDNGGGAVRSASAGRLRSPPDGYTISFGHLGTHVANGAIYKLGYDLVADSRAGGAAAEQPDGARTARMQFPAKSLRELMEWLKARPEPAHRLALPAPDQAATSARCISRASAASSCNTCRIAARDLR